MSACLDVSVVVAEDLEVLSVAFAREKEQLVRSGFQILQQAMLQMDALRIEVHELQEEKRQAALKAAEELEAVVSELRGNAQEKMEVQRSFEDEKGGLQLEIKKNQERIKELEAQVLEKEQSLQNLNVSMREEKKARQEALIVVKQQEQEIAFRIQEAENLRQKLYDSELRFSSTHPGENSSISSATSEPSINHKSSEIEKLLVTLDDREGQLKHYEQKSHRDSEAILSLQSENTVLQQRVQDQYTRILELEGQISGMRSAIEASETITRESKDLSKKIEKYEGEICKLEEILDQRMMDLDGAKISVEERDQQIHIYKEKETQLLDRLAILENDIQILENNLHSERSLVQEVSHRLKHLETEVETKDHNLLSQAALIERLQSENNSLNSHVKLTDERYNSLMAEKENMMISLSEMKAQLSKFTVKVEELQLEKDESCEKIYRLEEDAVGLKSLSDQYANEVKTLRSDCERLILREKELLDSLRHSENRFQALLSDQDQGRKALESLAAQSARNQEVLANSILELKGDVNKLTMDRNETMKQYKAIFEERQSMALRISELKSELESLRSSRDSNKPLRSIDLQENVSPRRFSCHVLGNNKECNNRVDEVRARDLALLSLQEKLRSIDSMVSRMEDGVRKCYLGTEIEKVTQHYEKLLSLQQESKIGDMVPSKKTSLEKRLHKLQIDIHRLHDKVM